MKSKEGQEPPREAWREVWVTCESPGRRDVECHVSQYKESS